MISDFHFVIIGTIVFIIGIIVTVIWHKKGEKLAFPLIIMLLGVAFVLRGAYYSSFMVSSDHENDLEVYLPEDDIILEKPVIYLYGFDGDVTVKLNLSDKMNLVHTYPKYDNGWRVKVSEDGKLSDGKRQYNYLFWEGVTSPDFEWNMDSGFCVEGADTQQFLEIMLKKFGLNDYEADDFITYWLPRMEDNAYNAISFQGKNYTDAAQIETSKKADAIIRVYMVWYASDTPVDIPVQKVKDNSDYVRNGRTVVEWGGTELKREGESEKVFEKDESQYSETFDGIGNVSLSSDGTHVFTDYEGTVHNFSEDEWSKLVTAWSWTGNPEMYLQKQTVKTLMDQLAVISS